MGVVGLGEREAVGKDDQNGENQAQRIKVVRTARLRAKLMARNLAMVL